MKKVLLAIQVEGELPFDGLGELMCFPALMSGKYVYAKVSKEKLPLSTSIEYIKIRRFNAPDISKKFKECGLRVNIREIFATNSDGTFYNPGILPLSDDNSFEKEVIKELDFLDSISGEFATDILECLSDLINSLKYLQYLQEMYTAEEAEIEDF